jgi:hypothetical protein
MPPTHNKRNLLAVHNICMANKVPVQRFAVNKAKIGAFKAIRKMIEKHQDDILNYFREGQTNA